MSLRLRLLRPWEVPGLSLMRLKFHVRLANAAAFPHSNQRAKSMRS